MTNPAFDFFHALYATAPETSWLYLSVPRANGKGLKQHWFDTLEGAASAAMELGETETIYYGVALAPEPYGENHRVCLDKGKDAKGVSKYRPPCAIPGFWMDIDFGNRGHKKGSLPPTLADALDLANSCGLRPTVAVNTGGGLHLYWLFEQCWEFADEGELLRAASDARRWGDTFVALAQKRGWEVDATSDLPRIMRVPGTWNRKEGYDPVEVETLWLDGPRYTLPDFEPHYLAPARMPKLQQVGDPMVATVSVDGLTFDPEAEPPARKYAAAQINDPLFARTCNRTRKDMKDSSASAWDQAVANACVGMGWDDQEIVDTIIYLRRQHGEDLQKAVRPDYHAKTIATARENYGHLGAVALLPEPDATDGPDGPLGVTAEPDGPAGAREPESRGDEQARIRELLRQSLGGLEVRRLIKYVAQHAHYELETQKGVVFLGPAGAILQQARFRERVMDGVNHIVPEMKSPAWLKVANLLLQLREERDVGEDGTDIGMVKGWLQDYFRDHTPGPYDPDAARVSAAPYRREGAIYLSIKSLNVHLTMKLGEKRGWQELAQLLTRIGATKVREQDGSSIRRWRLPEGVWEEGR